MNKSFRSVLLLTVLTFAASGCRPPEPAPMPEPGPGLAGKSITVVTTYGPNDGGRMAFEELCGEFQRDTGAVINNNSADSTEEWKQSVIASYNGGDEPDVLFYFTGPDAEALIQKGKFVSLDEIRRVFPDYASNINLSVLEGLKASDGKRYAVPVKGYWERLFINADIFEALDLSPPESYDDLFRLAPRFLEEGYIPMAASLGEVPHYLFEALLFNHTGPSNHHDIPTDPDDLPESWVRALEQFAAMYAAGMFPADTDVLTHAEAFELFQSKKAAMIIDGDWTTPQVRDTEHTAVINFPAGPGGPRRSTDLISGFSMGFYISRKAWDDPEKRAAAAAFVEFITSDASIMRLNVSGAAMPISGSGAAGSQEGATPLRRSIDELNQTTTAFVGAVGDRMRPEARALLFGRIVGLARGEIGAEDLLREFVEMNNAGRQP